MKFFWILQSNSKTVEMFLRYNFWKYIEKNTARVGYRSKTKPVPQGWMRLRQCVRQNFRGRLEACTPIMCTFYCGIVMTNLQTAWESKKIGWDGPISTRKSGPPEWPNTDFGGWRDPGDTRGEGGRRYRRGRASAKRVAIYQPALIERVAYGAHSPL